MGKVSEHLVVSLVLLCVSELLLVIGVATPRWVEGHDFNDGLYERCNTTSNACGDPSSSGFWFTARSLLIEVCIGVFLAIVLLVLFIVMVTKDSLERYRKCCSYSFPRSVFSSAIFAAIFIAVALILIDVDVFDYNNYEPKPSLGYSFYLAMTACIFLPFGGYLAYRGRTSPPKVESIDDGDTAVEATVAVENGHKVLKEKETID